MEVTNRIPEALESWRGEKKYRGLLRSVWLVPYKCQRQERLFFGSPTSLTKLLPYDHLSLLLNTIPSAVWQCYSYRNCVSPAAPNHPYCLVIDRNIEDDKQESTERENRRAKVIQPRSDGPSDEQKREFSLLIDQYEDIFAINDSDLG